MAGAFTAGNREGDPYEAVRSDDMMIPTEAEHDRVWGPPGSAIRAAYAPAALVRGITGGARPPKFYFEVGRSDFPRVMEASAVMRDLLRKPGPRSPSPSTRAIIPGPMRRRRWRGWSRNSARSLTMAETALMSRDELFPVAFRFEDARFGTCVGVHLPAACRRSAGAACSALHPEERELCRAMRGARLEEFAGGRVASRLARAGMPDEAARP